MAKANVAAKNTAGKTSAGKVTRKPFLGISGLRTLQRRREDQGRSLSPEQSGRAWTFAEILGRATEVFGSREGALDWLQRPALALDGRRPIDLLRTPVVDAMTFALGSGIAGIAGVALSQIDNVSPDLGGGYIIDSFMVVVFGGVGNLWGTFVGAMTLGIVNKFLEPYAGAVLGKIVVLVLIILFIQKRPRGLFAQKGRFVDA